MNVKSVEGILVIISVAVSIIASGCSNGNNPVNKDNSNPVVTTVDVLHLDDNFVNDERQQLNKNEGTDNTEKNTETDDTVYEEILDDGEPKMDYIAILEYDKTRQLEKKDYYETLDNSCPQTWCFQRKKDHSQSGTYENFHINDYFGEYVDQTVTDDDKVMYLTFDCGYPSDLTVKILDTLKKHNAKGNSL